MDLHRVKYIVRNELPTVSAGAIVGETKTARQRWKNGSKMEGPNLRHQTMLRHAQPQPRHTSGNK